MTVPPPPLRRRHRARGPLVMVAALVPAALASCKAREPVGERPPVALIGSWSAFPPGSVELPVAVPLAPLLAGDEPDRLTMTEPEGEVSNVRPGQSLTALTSRLLLGLEAYLADAPADLILGHGDTTTCFATAVAAFYARIPFFHVEAGLRSGRIDSPFPEEFNRQSLVPLAAHHFAPTLLEKENLLKEGVSTLAVTVTGTTV
ncbi:MAG: hypothetical protein EOO74_08095, partial [Myxococcales bacterium]